MSKHDHLGPTPHLFTGYRELATPRGMHVSNSQRFILETVRIVRITVLVYTIMLSSKIQAKDVVQRPNYGILFQPMGRMQATNNK